MSSVAENAKIIAKGLAFGESPRWHEGRLWLCNWGTGEIVAVSDEGKSRVMLTVPAVLPYSIDWLPDGRLLVISGREGLLLRQEVDGRLVTHADLRDLSKSPWNEIVVDGRGNIYVNGGGPAPAPGQHFGPGTIVLITPDGTARQVAGNIAFANGMAVTPDNRTLIIAESHSNRLTAFDIAADGTLANRRVWADVDGYPDGICLDAEGTVWYADVPNKRCAQVREGGEVMQTVTADRGCFACMLGGVDGRTLFITAAEWRGFDHMSSDARTGQVLGVAVSSPGAGWPSYISGTR
ncbi:MULTISPECIES: SMP-30/gluconolactonase/LRE family protein [unclassified Mesorhizobium]|uniref:SMP-30/gluconolactonase/LRE family protein n=1 Tax=unclassified Mesorhizobium TaxID=325217 RepID=UPI00112BC3BD|nr:MULTISPECIES: SMP-30/gluconolactonase/LRE family protein [unclassified Mesorhizobium]MCA0026255.1 SMP-30/gluconolactonase/LRE family protein [Mesorhizobium sp. B263B1A]TPJ96496.1 SMP-30/gluconolactonase/LRE family protein [Mesorhizobium sp. B2-5-12]TPK29298.1 SMP-30/gluconolactonase/LRE family protein [Mesorhizobium sp. B2-5-6]TPK60263.1 SMP-30/gluconolactonase/LRE family protein [Mesorhizobium sp. B2-5-1]TPM65326.1 SMP-30/gluconolactonase/LRE family protein [Mesorhizobium sp. B2-1-9]